MNSTHGKNIDLLDAERAIRLKKQGRNNTRSKEIRGSSVGRWQNSKEGSFYLIKFVYPGIVTRDKRNTLCQQRPSFRWPGREELSHLTDEGKSFLARSDKPWVFPHVCHKSKKRAGRWRRVASRPVPSRRPPQTSKKNGAAREVGDRVGVVVRITLS